MNVPNIAAMSQRMQTPGRAAAAPAQAVAAQPPAPPAHSPLVAALEALPRKTIDYPADAAFPGLTAHTIKVRIATSDEQDRAIVGAYAYVAKVSEAAPKAAEDVDLLSDTKTTFILAHTLRDGNDPVDLPAFPSAEWVKHNLTTHQIAVLLNMYNQTVFRLQPVAKEEDLSSDAMTALALMCAQHAGTEIPDRALIRFSREIIAEFFIRLAQILADVMTENAALLSRMDELQAENAQLKAGTGEPSCAAESSGDEQPEPSADDSAG
jgi:hypothetical protein